MDTDELEPVVVTPKKVDLDAMSVEALQDYITSLREEIQRAEDAIDRKGNARDLAESFFKKR